MTETSQHLSDWTLEQLAEGALDGAELRAASGHIEDCRRCAAELDGYRALYAALSDLPRFAPSPAFNEQVMARVTVAPQSEPLWGWMQRWMPATRRGWALLTLAVVAPALPVIALVAWLLSNPAVSLGAVWQGASMQAQAAVQTGFAWALDRGLETGVFGLLASAYDAALATPTQTMAGLLFVLSVAIPLSAWSLFKLVRAPLEKTDYAN